MDVEKFVTALRNSAPTRDDFRSYNLSDDFITGYIGSFVCNRKESVNSTVENNAVLKLLQEYDCSKVKIGLVNFVSEIVEHSDYFVIGNVDLDKLVLNKITLEIEVRDHDCLSHLLWPCASNGSNLLDALIMCSEFFRLLFKDNSLGDNSNFVLSWVVKCTDAAGGDKYMDFYKMLLGYFE